MKTFPIVLGAVLLSAVCSNPGWLLLPGHQPACAGPAAGAADQSQITYKGGPGDTLKTAVIISGAANAMAGIAAEYRYLKKKFGRENDDWMLTRQSVVQQDNKFFDRLDLDLKNGRKKTVFFDISEFFGKL